MEHSSWVDNKPMDTSQQGRWAEQRVLRLLLSQGWRLVCQRWRCRYGEIDLLLSKGPRLLAVEVKARQHQGPDQWGLMAFGEAKRLRMARALSCWLQAQPLLHSESLEVVLALVALPPSRKPIRWIRIESLAESRWCLE